MKKLLALLLAAVMVFSMAACGSSSAQTTTSTATTAAAATAATSAAATTAASGSTAAKSASYSGEHLVIWTNLTADAQYEVLNKQFTELADQMGITIDVEKVSFNEMYEKLATAVSAGEAPDILHLSLHGQQWNTSQGVGVRDDSGKIPREICGVHQLVRSEQPGTVHR